MVFKNYDWTTSETYKLGIFFSIKCTSMKWIYWEWLNALCSNQQIHLRMKIKKVPDVRKEIFFIMETNRF